MTSSSYKKYICEFYTKKFISVQCEGTIVEKKIIVKDLCLAQLTDSSTE